MNAKKPNISQIDKYLKGELDARAMHQLERQAQDDPFLMDALEGYEKAGKDQQANLADLKEQLAKRTAPAKQRSLILWQVLPIAATILLMLGAGYWFFKPSPARKQYATVIVQDKKPKQDVITPSEEQKTIIQQGNATVRADINMEPHEPVSNMAYKTDTKEYLPNPYDVKPNTSIKDILKKMEGVEVNPDGSIAFQGQAVAGAKLSGKDFKGGNLANAIQNLPADIVENLQIADTLNKTSLIAASRPAPQLREVSISGSIANDRTVNGKVLDQQGAPLIGATVKVDGTDKGVATDINGNFKIDLPANKDLLAVNYIGYNTQQVKVGKQNNLNIALQNNNNSLNEVIIVGYGVQKRSNLVGAISTLPANTRMYDQAQGSIACNENLKFKTQFFDHIAVVEKHTNENIAAIAHTIKTTDFKKALAFLNKYTKVLANAPDDTGYKDIQTFKADKDQWLKWYEANKCNNLK